MLLGLALGLMLGCALAIVFAASAGWRRWALPLVIVSQAIPVIAIAPLLVLWLGFGMASKVAMAALVIFFPVASALYDGLRRTDPGWLDLARTMDASAARPLLQIRLPAALPAFASGARIAAAVAPIGAVIGEWVGASAGLGYLMTQQLARGQTSLAFAALSCSACSASRSTTRPTGRRAGSCPGNCLKENDDAPSYRLLAALALASLACPAAAQDKVRVLLDWFVNPDHAALVIAKQRGFFARHGLAVELIAPADPNAPPKLVAAGQADYAVSYQPALQMLAAEGLPLVRVGVLVAQPLNALVTLERRPDQDRSPTSRAEGSAIPSRASKRPHWRRCWKAPD